MTAKRRIRSADAGARRAASQWSRGNTGPFSGKPKRLAREDHASVSADESDLDRPFGDPPTRRRAESCAPRGAA